jgi:hypothetical protein
MGWRATAVHGDADFLVEFAPGAVRNPFVLASINRAPGTHRADRVGTVAICPRPYVLPQVPSSRKYLFFTKSYSQRLHAPSTCCMLTRCE